MIRFAIPSKGGLYDATLQFLEGCGLQVSRPNPRQYTAKIRSLPEAEVLLHRPEEIVHKVVVGDVDIGVTGLDLVRELAGDDPNVIVAEANLGFGRSDLVMAVPEAWVDVQSWADVADLAAEFASAGRQLRIATKYPNVVRTFCYQGGVNVFTLVNSQGATEAAPVLGYADLIADITETGTTLRENRLKIVAGTTILRSQACLIAGRRALQQDAAKLRTVQTVLELIEARRRARGYAQVIANVPGESAADVGQRVALSPDLGGLQGPTVAPVYDREDGALGAWFAVSVIVGADRILPAVAQLRALGSTGIVVLPLQYAFGEQSQAFAQLLEALEYTG
ncbi:MAG: ATP phosphoribosyltransferase [Chloroflexota bacterium]|nr:ATP phosphoribosyltransferase [Chloroflexota bacterium]